MYIFKKYTLLGPTLDLFRKCWVIYYNYLTIGSFSFVKIIYWVLRQTKERPNIYVYLCLYIYIYIYIYILTHNQKQ